MVDQAEALRNMARQRQLETAGSAAAVIEAPASEIVIAPAPNVIAIPSLSNIAVVPDIIDAPPAPAVNIQARVITVTSGKGGVGKTNFTVNLAMAMAKRGKRVFIIDADFGLANIEVLFGVIPRYNLSHVFNGTMELKDIVTEGPSGIKFLSGGSGLRELAKITDMQMAYIIDKFTYIDSVSDIILIDTGAGISDSIISFIKASSETVIITTPEPTSVTDAYAIVKAARETGGGGPIIKLVINRVDDFKEGSDIYNKISKVAKRFLDLDLINLGYIPYDNSMVKAVKNQKPMISVYPNCEASRAIEAIARKLLETPETSQGGNGIKGFMKKLTGIFK